MARPTNTQFALAVHVLTLLGSELDERHSSEQLADSAGSSAVHVRRVLGGLRRAGLGRSRPRPHGGLEPVAPPPAAALAGGGGGRHRGDPPPRPPRAQPGPPPGPRL